MEGTFNRITNCQSVQFYLHIHFHKTFCIMKTSTFFLRRVKVQFNEGL